MLIIGCDFHTRSQQIAMAREETAEMIVERRLDHASGEAKASCRSLQSFEEPVRVGIEATGPIHWFERLLTELGHELWIGEPSFHQQPAGQSRETILPRMRHHARS